MTTAIDSNILAALWNSDDSLNLSAEKQRAAGDIGSRLRRIGRFVFAQGGVHRGWQRFSTMPGGGRIKAAHNRGASLRIS